MKPCQHSSPVQLLPRAGGVGEWVSERLGSGLKVLAFKSQLAYILIGVTFGRFFTFSLAKWGKRVHPVFPDGHQKHLGNRSLEMLAGIIFVLPRQYFACFPFFLFCFYARNQGTRNSLECLQAKTRTWELFSPKNILWERRSPCS